MAITTALCNSFKQEILQGIHLAADTYKIALFSSVATLNKSTTAYSTTNEVTGTGYTAGGKTLSGFAVTLDGDTACLDFDDPAWTSATLTAAGALIYNASRSNKAVATYSFGGDVSSTNATFTAQLPAPAAATALIRIA
jgi:hypothetical protein